MWVLQVLLLALVVSTVTAEIVIQYTPPSLSFLLTEYQYDRSVGGVVFHYGLNNARYSGRAYRLSGGWQYIEKSVDVKGADAVYVYAEIYDVTGNVRQTTTTSSLELSGVSTDRHPRLPRRQIREAVIFRDDFNSFSTNNWQYEVSMYGGYNGEFQVYTNEQRNVFARNGNLYIKPTLTTDDPRFDDNFLYNGIMDMNALFGVCTNGDQYGCHREGKYGLLPPVMSGRINSAATLKYGTVEIRARIPKGDWLWPAIWMLPKSNVYGTWPRSGEIDIMESRGNTGPIGVGTVSSTLHWGPSAGENRFQMTTAEKHTSSWFDNFHTWRLHWTPDHIITSVDNQEILRVYPGGSFWQKGGFGGNNIWSSGSKMAPFDQEFYMILNVAVGGTSGFFPDGIHYPTNKPWNNGAPKAAEDFWNGRNGWQYSWHGDDVAMMIDYVEFKTL